MGALLASRLARPVRVLTLADDVRAELARLGWPVRVATYLLTEGQFVTSLRDAANGIGIVAPPIGVHPALVRLVWERYFAVLHARWPR
jgi:sirohydrochlorin ferrochelatase